MARNSLFLRLAGVVAIVLGVAVAGLVPAWAASVTATFTKVSSWDTGYTGQVTVRNDTGTAVTGWRVEFDLPAGTSVGAYWDGLMTRTGNHYVFTNRDYNGTVGAGQSVSFGFNGVGTGAPTNCRINGAPCAGGATPSPSATPTTGPPTTAPPTTPPPTTPPPTTPPPTSPPPTTPPSSGLPRHAMVGYLHASFANGSGYIRMRDVSDDWDIINLAFAEPTSVTSGQLRFSLCPVAECPNVESEADFIAGIRAKQAKGKKVLISIGGANGQVQLASTAARDAFVSSVSAIIDRYGLNGLDIDFEGRHSLSLNAGDTDFRNPKTPVIVNLISALKTLKARYGSKFVLTMAPETFFVQLGYQFYGPGPNGSADPRAGSYLPVIHALRNDLTLLHVQDYNSGPIMGLDDQYHTMGGADFHIAMTDMLLAGFPVARNPNNVFPALRPDQVAIGLPASPQAGNGFTTVGGVHTALDCLTKGQGCGGYRLRGGPQRNLRGLMTWSVNWDRFNGYEFSRSHRAYLNALP